MKFLVKGLFLISFLSFSVINVFAQLRIDETVEFQSDPEKQYSIYVPSNYDVEQPSKLMLGLHPWNTSRWNSISWCDTLIQFAEANNLLLVCPDGGADGQVDDPIDIAFTTAILDSMELWYNVDEQKVFAMGFSWGGKTTYSYGLANSERFAGFMPIGAAIDGTSELSADLPNASNKAFYIIHGTNDSPNSRYYPILEALEENGACIETQLLSGVGHTIDFPNRNSILSEAFDWLDSVVCGEPIAAIENDIAAGFNKLVLHPNPLTKGSVLSITGIVDTNSVEGMELFALDGRSLWKHENYSAQELNNFLFETPIGAYILKIKQDGLPSVSEKLIVH